MNEVLNEESSQQPTINIGIIGHVAHWKINPGKKFIRSSNDKI